MIDTLFAEKQLKLDAAETLYANEFVLLKDESDDDRTPRWRGTGRT